MLNTCTCSFMSMAAWEGGGCEGARVGRGCEREGARGWAEGARGRERVREGASGWDGWDGWDGTRVDSIFGLDSISHFSVSGLDSIFVFANYANSQAELHTTESTASLELLSFSRRIRNRNRECEFGPKPKTLPNLGCGETSR